MSSKTSALEMALYGKWQNEVLYHLCDALSDEERKEYLTEAFVQKGSPLAGISAGESDLLKRSSVRILEIIRDEVALPGRPQCGG